METSAKTRKHPILDKTILSYFILILVGQLFESLFGFVDRLLAKVVPGYAMTTAVTLGEQEYSQVSAMGLGTALGALLALLIFRLWFRPHFRGSLRKEYLTKGLLMLAPMALIHFSGSLVSIGILGLGNVGVAALRCLAPGFGEEVCFRGLGAANYMRKATSERQVVGILWLSAAVFGFFHMGNVLGGAKLSYGLIQSVYACGVGLLFGAVFLRTGNLWPTIIAHSLVDFLEMARADMATSGGIMVNMTVGDWITVAAGVVAAATGIYLCRKEKRGEILNIWAERWSKEPTGEIAGE